MTGAQHAGAAIVYGRRKFLGAAASCVMALPLAARAQPTGHLARIGVLGSGSYNAVAHEPFLRGLRELGWVQGQNVIIDYRFADGSIERLPGLAAEVTRRQRERKKD